MLSIYFRRKSLTFLTASRRSLAVLELAKFPWDFSDCEKNPSSLQGKSLKKQKWKIHSSLNSEKFTKIEGENPI